MQFHVTPGPAFLLADNFLTTAVGAVWPYLLLAIGFSLVIFVHELGHFAAAKWAGVRVEKFAIGFGRELVGFTWGETRYSLNMLPLGGFVKMLGQEDFVVDKSGELKVRDDPRSFTNKSIGKRMIIVSAGVVMNLLFAAGALTIVAMVGKPEPPSVVGVVLPGSAASRAGLQIGDEIRAINSEKVASFEELKAKVVLSDPGEVLELDVYRDGRLVQPRPRVVPEYQENASERQLGFTPGMNLRIQFTLPPAGDESPPADVLHQDDVLAGYEKGGGMEPSRDLGAFQRALVEARGRPVSLEVRRPVDSKSLTSDELLSATPTEKSEPARVTARAAWVVIPETAGDRDSASLLGLIPRQTFIIILPKKSLDKAGVKLGDVVVRIGDVRNPTYNQLKDTIAEHGGETIALFVRRSTEGNRGLSADVIRFCVDRREEWIASGREGMDAAKGAAEQSVKSSGLLLSDQSALLAELAKPADASAWRQWLDAVDVHELADFKPKAPFSLIGKSRPPAIDGELLAMDEDQIVVAGIAPEINGRPSPAAGAGIPSGAVIVAADGKPVRKWYELCEAFRRHAGKDITLAMRVGDDRRTVTLHVPDCVTASLDLPGGANIVEIDGKRTFKPETVTEGQPKELTLPDWRAVRGLLSQSAGRTVDVQYTSGDGATHTARLDIAAGADDPWLQRVLFSPPFGCYPLLERHPVPNPIQAAKIGFKRAYEWTVVTIETIRHVAFTRQVGVDKVSGPVGIIAMGGQIADAGITPLLWFLGVISANLAVINFLPLPIVDGGLFVFLLLEKIRGEPLSIKTQVATQLIGIALIATLFILITYQDILRLIGV